MVIAKKFQDLNGNRYRIVTVCLILILLFLVSIRLLEPLDRSSSIFTKIFGLPIGIVLPFYCALLLLFFLLNPDIRARATESIREDFQGQESLSPKRHLTALCISIPPMTLLVYLVSTEIVDYLLDGVDGDYTFAQSVNHVQLNQHTPYFTFNILQGVGGNTFLPNNLGIDPAAYILGHFQSEIGLVLSNTLWVLLFYVSTFYITYSLRLTPQTSIYTSLFSISLIVFPSVFRWTPIFAQCPWIVATLAIGNIIIARLILNFSNNAIHYLKILREFLVNVCLIYLLAIYSPLWVIIYLPVLLILAYSFSQKRMRANWFRFLSPWIVFFICGGGVYLLGFYLSSASFFYSQDFVMPEKLLKHISLVFRGFPITLLYIVAFVAFVFARKSQKKSAIYLGLSKSFLIFYSFSFVVGGMIFVFQESYPGPPLIYTEFFLLSLLGILIAIFLKALFLSLMKTVFPKKMITDNSLVIILSILLAIGLLAYETSLPRHSKWSFPPSNKIIDELKTTSIYKGGAYSGRVATFTGMNVRESLNQPELQELNYKLLGSFGDDFRHAGMWFYGIPTLSEYNHVISAKNYRFMKENFFRLGDKSYRNVLVMRNVNVSSLKLVGVSRIISDAPIENLSDPVTTLLSNGYEIFLYELENANTSAYFAYDLSDEPLPHSQVDPKIHSKLTIEDGRYKFSASSDTLVWAILPIEFSNCLNFVSSNSFVVSEFNNFLVALQFRGNLELEIEFKYGPFHNSSCKFQDFLDSYSLNK